MPTKRILLLVAPLLLVLLAVAGTSKATKNAQPFIVQEDCGDDHAPAETPSSVKSPLPLDGQTPIHRHWEGVVFPLDGEPGDVDLQSVKVQAYANFFSCMVRNFIVNSSVTITMANSSTENITGYGLVFPFSTHALYGDHNRFRDIKISVDGAPAQFQVALDHTLYETRADGLYYGGRLINGAVHPLITGTVDTHSLSSFLVQEGFDMVAYWQLDFVPHQQRAVQIDYTSNSDDFSSCCPGVSDPTHSIDPYYFYFDLSNAGYWGQPLAVRILLHDTGSAVWSDVPQLDLHNAITSETLEFWAEGVVPTQDLAVPVQPNVFGVSPRLWSWDGQLEQEFTLNWISSGLYFTRTEIYDIQETTGVAIKDVALPLYLSEMSPTASFSATLNLTQLSQPAYLDVYGKRPGAQAHLHRSFIRVPIKAPTITTQIFLPVLLR